MSDDYRTHIHNAVKQGSQLVMVGEYPTDVVLEYLRQSEETRGAVLAIARHDYIVALVDRDGSKRAFVYDDGKWVEQV